MLVIVKLVGIVSLLTVVVLELCSNSADESVYKLVIVTTSLVSMVYVYSATPLVTSIVSNTLSPILKTTLPVVTGSP